MNSPAVSVVMVVRNVERFLAEAIESILSQTFRDFEFLILDFGSTDDTKSIVSSYAKQDARIKFHETAPCGLAEARNAVSFLAQGRYVAVQDADDISLPERLAVEVQFLESHPRIGFVGSATEWIDPRGNPLWIHRVPTKDTDIRCALLTCCPFIQSSVLFRREAFASVGGYRPPFAPAEDYDLWIRISEHFECANLEQVLVRYRIHPYQLSLRNRKQQSLGVLAAQESATLRRTKNSDPFDQVMQITPAVLSEYGVTEAKQQAGLFTDYRDWIRNMFIAREYSVALKAATEVLQSDWQTVERPKIADLQFMVARLYWKQNQHLRSFAAACKAMATQPQIVGDLFGSVLRRFGLV